MNYKEGDLVRLDESKAGDWISYVKEAAYEHGYVGRIDARHVGSPHIYDLYRVVFTDGREAYFDSRHILGPHFRYGEEVVVSDGEERWHRMEFAGYIAGQRYPVHTTGQSYKYVRPVRQRIELVIKKDGKEVCLGEVDDAVLENIKSLIGESNGEM